MDQPVANARVGSNMVAVAAPTRRLDPSCRRERAASAPYVGSQRRSSLCQDGRCSEVGQCTRPPTQPVSPGGGGAVVEAWWYRSHRVGGHFDSSLTGQAVWRHEGAGLRCAGYCLCFPLQPGADMKEIRQQPSSDLKSVGGQQSWDLISVSLTIVG